MILDLIILFFVIMARFIISLYYNEHSSDNIFHRYYVKNIKANAHILPLKEKRVVGGDNSYSYPYFFHLLLSYFPEKILIFFDKYLGFIIDFLFSLLICIIFGDSLGLKLATCYLLSPGFYINPSSPHGFGLSPRIFCYFIWILVFIVLYTCQVYSINDLYIKTFFLISCLFAGVGFLSSKFFIQVYCFTLLSLIFFFSRYDLLYHGIITFFFAYLLSAGKIIKILKAHLKYIRWYYIYLKKFTSHILNFSNLLKFLKKYNLRSLFYELHHNSLVFRSVVFYAPLHVFLISGDLNINNDDLFLPAILSCILFFVLTLFWPLRIFGDSERYIRYAYPLSYIWAASQDIKVNTNYILVIECYFFILLLIHIFRFVYKNENTIMNQLKKIAKITSNHSNELILPAKQNDRYFFLNHTKHYILGFFVQLGCSGSKDHFSENFFISYPHVNLIDNVYLEKYSPKYIVLNKDHPQFIKNDESCLKSKFWSCIYETENYFLYIKKNNL